jgi:hypothetical protein
MQLPVDLILEKLHSDDDIVLVGVAGCGKSRTCFDICRNHMCIYLDWAHHCDLSLAKSLLERIKRPTNLSDSSCESEFEKNVELLTMRILVSR